MVEMVVSKDMSAGHKGLALGVKALVFSHGLDEIFLNTTQLPELRFRAQLTTF